MFFANRIFAPRLASAALAVMTILGANATAQTPPAACGLTNASVRTSLANGQTLIVGGVVSGGTKLILVRATGPALNASSSAGLANPQLELYRTGTSPAATNDD